MSKTKINIECAILVFFLLVSVAVFVSQLLCNDCIGCKIMSGGYVAINAINSTAAFCYRRDMHE